MAARINEGTQFFDENGNPIVNGSIYIGLQGADPEVSPITIYSDRALSVVLANPQNTDSQGRSINKIWIPGAYSIKVKDSLGVQKYIDQDAGEPAGIQSIPLTNVVGTNAITADANPTISALTDKAKFVARIANTNTNATGTTVTIDIDGTGAKSLFRNNNQNILKGQLVQDFLIEFMYDLTNDRYVWLNENRRVIYRQQASDIAAAATVDLATANGNQVTVTGKGGPITGLGTVEVGALFELLFPGVSAVAITSSSIASPTNILTGAPHGLTTGDRVYIEGHSGSIPDINGFHTATVVDPSNFTIPVNVTTGGTGGTVAAVPQLTHHATNLDLPGEEDLDCYPGSSLVVKSTGAGTWQGLRLDPHIFPFKRATPAQAIVQSAHSDKRFLSVLAGWLQNQQMLADMVSVLTATDAAHPVPTWARNALIFATGGGGAGGDGVVNPHGGGGGGAGGNICALVSVTPGGTLNCVVGAGATSSSANGGNTTVDTTLVVANGGVGGVAASGGGGAGGAGGTTSTTGTQLNAGTGDPGTAGATGSAQGGVGGDARGIFAGRGGAAQNNGSLAGAGGGGGNNGTSTGDGADGRIMIIWLG